MVEVISANRNDDKIDKQVCDEDVVTTEETRIGRTSMRRRALASAVGIDGLYSIAMMVLIAMVIFLLIVFVPPIEGMYALIMWNIYGDSHLGGGLTGPYHFIQLSIIVAAIFVFARKKGSKGLRYLERSEKAPLEPKFKQMYRLSLGLSLAMVFLLTTELAFCSFPETCFTHNYHELY